MVSITNLSYRMDSEENRNPMRFLSFSPIFDYQNFLRNHAIGYTQCTVKLRPNFQKIAQLKCTTNEKRNLSEHDEKNFKWKIFS